MPDDATAAESRHLRRRVSARSCSRAAHAPGWPARGDGGPVRFGPSAQGIFVRDPDANVIELHQRG
ncbi:MAG TPA: hypothetical protein VGG39_37205 [Polyangiaceae bacterium]